jgi:histidyl-tRNA synthetase
MATEASLSQEIQQQIALHNKLKADGAEATVIDEAWKKLGELKKSLGALKKAASGGKDSSKKKERLLLKTAKVTSSSLPSFGTLAH